MTTFSGHAEGSIVTRPVRPKRTKCDKRAHHIYREKEDRLGIRFMVCQDCNFTIPKQGGKKA